MNHTDVAIIIPSRIGSERLPRKPLEIIGDKTMIEHVALRALAAGIGTVIVATDYSEIEKVLAPHNIQVVFTDSSCASGTDRVYQAWQRLPNKDEIKFILNVQGDMPFVDPKVISTVVNTLKDGKYKVLTPVTKVSKEIADHPANVKVAIDAKDKALYFSRSLIPSEAQDFWYHIGIYGFTAEALENFVKLPQAILEKQERLEQLRLLENGIDIGICYADSVPISVDTAYDLEKARQEFVSMLKGSRTS